MAFLAKIAVELQDAVARRTAGKAGPAPPVARLLAQGPGWSVDDVLCTYGPRDRAFPEEHSQFSIALVLAGTFQYRSATGNHGAGQLMTPGSLLLGNPGQRFECTHVHGHGDRCLAFHFAQDFFERVAADAGAGRDQRVFRGLSLPAARELSPVVVRACAQFAGLPDAAASGPAWEEIAMQVAASAVRLANLCGGTLAEPPASVAARITRTVRRMEESPESEWPLRRLAGEAGLSPYHFLRTFEQVTGVTPHQYVQRLRLRRAAAQLLTDSSSILDVVMECGFGDLSSFNRAFRREFGASPRQFRCQGQ